MLGSALPSPAAATIHTNTSTATPTSPTRPSRLRGLSYLRSYTHNHLSSRGDTQTSPQLSRSTSSPGFAADIPPPPPLQEQRTFPIRRRSRNTRPREDIEAETSSTIQNGADGWLPTVHGRSGLSRDSLHPTPTTESASPEVYMNNQTEMTRNRASSAQPGPTPTSRLTNSQSRAALRRQSPHTETEREGGMTSEGSTGPAASSTSTNNANSKDTLPTIRFIPHVETRTTRPSLHFAAITRTLQQPHNIVRVGRYSERESNPAPNPNTHTSVAPVGFKSKVVSRRHCEFWCTNGQWYVKDVKSSSGTFLNHVRLSSPGAESRPYPVNDGDVVQLGIDFKGGEEVIFRCVKIRVECNRGWQKGLNSFNTSTHKRLLKNNASGTNNNSSKNKLAAGRDSDGASMNASSECSICLNPVAPCQALFVAPCSHVWHYKCVRNLIHGPNYPNFLCPNCRFVADLEGDVEQPEPPEEEEEVGAEFTESGNDEEIAVQEGAEERSDEDRSNGARDEALEDEEIAGMMDTTCLQPHTGSSDEDRQQQEPGASRPMMISRQASSSRDHRKYSSELLSPRSATPTSSAQFALAAGVMSMREQRESREPENGEQGAVNGQMTVSTEGGHAEGPVTPRNDAGPFVLDGTTRTEGLDQLASMDAGDLEQRR